CRVPVRSDFGRTGREPRRRARAGATTARLERPADPTRDTPEYIEHLFPCGLCWWEITGPVTMSGWLSTGEYRPLSLCQCHLLALVSTEQQRRGDVMARTPK